MANPTNPLPEPKMANTCFGFAVDSDVDLIACRPGRGTSLDISESDLVLEMPDVPLFDWYEDHQSFARLWAEDPRFTLWIASLGWFEIDKAAPSIVIPSQSNGIRREARLWGIPAALCFIGRGDLALHAAAVDVGGAAVVLAAPGRYGKTTLAAAFMQAGHRLLSEDLTCVHTRDTPAIWPGPAVLRVRKDAFAALGFNGTNVVDEDETRMYVMPDDSARGSGDAVPLRAIIFLRTHDSPDVALEPLHDKGEALRDLWTLSFNLPNDDDRARCFATITELAGAVPIWNLRRPLSYETLPKIIETIERLVA